MFSKPIPPKAPNAPDELEYPGEDDKITLMVETTFYKEGSYTNYSSGDPEKCYESLKYLLSQENINFKKGPSFDVTIAVCDFHTVKMSLAYHDLQYKKQNGVGNTVDNTYFIVDKLLTKEAIEAALDGTVHDVVTWLKNAKETGFYSSYRKGLKTIGFSNPFFKELYIRRSVAPRRGYSGSKEDAEVYDLIIKRIEIYGPYTKNGWGTKFAENLLAALRREKIMPWISIHIEQLISEDGIRWGKTLINKHNWYKQLDVLGGDLNVFSPREELTRSNAMLPNGVTPIINPLHKKLDATVKLMKRNSLLYIEIDAFGLNSESQKDDVFQNPPILGLREYQTLHERLVKDWHEQMDSVVRELKTKSTLTLEDWHRLELSEEDHFARFLLSICNALRERCSEASETYILSPIMYEDYLSALKKRKHEDEDEEQSMKRAKTNKEL